VAPLLLTNPLAYIYAGYVYVGTVFAGIANLEGATRVCQFMGIAKGRLRKQLVHTKSRWLPRHPNALNPAKGFEFILDITLTDAGG
jgi:hypothetical protein